MQQWLKRDEITRQSKEFAFTKLITCGLCGSGVTADEKYKKLADGTTARYVYYGCTRSRDLHCKAGYLREEDLLKQLLEVVDMVDINELGIKKKFEEELARYRKFRAGVLGGQKENEIHANDVDVRNYMKYLLGNGNVTEKRELLSCLKSKLIFKDKKVQLAS